MSCTYSSLIHLPQILLVKSIKNKYGNKAQQNKVFTITFDRRRNDKENHSIVIPKYIQADIESGAK